MKEEKRFKFIWAILFVIAIVGGSYAYLADVTNEVAKGMITLGGITAAVIGIVHIVIRTKTGKSTIYKP